MAIHTDGIKLKIYMGSKKIKAAFAGVKVYSAGNICTYHVDGVTYQETVDEGESVLSPASFTIPEKSGYTFAGWSLKSGGEVLMSLTMGDEPIMLYAVYYVAPYTWIDNYVAASGQTLTVSGSGERIDYTFPRNSFNIQTRSNADGNTSFAVSTNQVKTIGLKTMHITLDYYKGSNGNSKSFRVNSSAGAKYDSNNQVNSTITVGISGANWVSISASCGCWPLNNPAYCRVKKVWFT